MRVEVDTSHDSHEDIRKVIKMLQHLVGESQEVFTNDAQAAASPMANIFGDMAPAAASQTAESAAAPMAETALEAPQETAEASSEKSTDDLFAELFNEEELKKMDTVKSKEEDEEEIKPAQSKGKQYSIEFY